MRVLILAEDCNPQWSSLPSVGYKAARALADHAQVVLATHIRNREHVEAAGLGPGTVRYFDTESIARPMYKLGTLLRGGSRSGWTTGIAMKYPTNLAFERAVYKACRSELERGDFDVVHRLTPMSPTLPSPMAKWSPVPFVLGPLNGGLPWPGAFRREMTREKEWLRYVRGIYRHLPYQKATYRGAAAILAAFPHTIRDLPAAARDRVIDFPEVGIDPTLFSHIENRPPRERKTILFAGRFVPCKLTTAIVHAYASQPRLHRHRLVMVGDGPERPRVEQAIADHGLQARVELPGWKTQAQVGELMREADIFAFPSIRELGGGVVVEAMACGLACVVADYGGPGSLIDADRGVKIPMGTRDQITGRLGEALVRLVEDPRTSVNLGAAARDHAMRYYTWDAKAKRTLAVYDWARGKGDRPRFRDRKTGPIEQPA